MYRFSSFPKLSDFMLFLAGCPILEDLLTLCLYFDSKESLTCTESKSSLLSNLARSDIDCFYCYFPLKTLHNVQSLRFRFYQVCYMILSDDGMEKKKSDLYVFLLSNNLPFNFFEPGVLP
jgi:hypothetical protein